ncbi:hypothetical protein HKX48_002024 [Thoreauomyces humboldtii]|nr:hypothetical protein HKX48_002024 [Thoreauomyces humboldtii]
MSLRILAAGSSDIGRRSSQQDEHLIQSPAFLPSPTQPQPHSSQSSTASSSNQPQSSHPPPPHLDSHQQQQQQQQQPSSHLLLVLDGHGADGGKVARFARDRFSVLVSPSIMTDPMQGVRDVFREVNEGLEEDQGVDTYMSGSTVAMVLVVGTRMVVANVGDSRVVIGRRGEGGGVEVVPLTRDHNCDEPTELERVTKAGARVERLTIGDQPDGPLRIFKGTLPYPGIVVTRALGDNVAKRLGVLHEPDVLVHDLSPTDLFLVMGTDGVWDGIKDSHLVDAYDRFPRDPDGFSREVTERSLKGMDELHLDDNTTNVVCCFAWE